MRLTDLDPKWLERAGRRIGVTFRCPGRKKWWITCFAEPTPNSAQAESVQAAVGDSLNWLPCKESIGWNFAGGIEAATFETLTITPSIDAGATIFHGHVTNGEVGVGEAFKMIKIFKIAAVAVLVAVLNCAAIAQTMHQGVPVVPMGYCQLSATQLGSAVGLSSCVRASFTGTGSGTTLTGSSVTGFIQAGDTVTGTGVPAGTTIVAQLTGTAGGAGTYQTSAATTSSGASLTSGGIPTDAQGHTPNFAILQAEVAAVRWRDDGGAPTAAVGMEVTTTVPLTYSGTMTKLQFIAASGSPLLDVAFYRTVAP